MPYVWTLHAPLHLSRDPRALPTLDLAFARRPLVLPSRPHGLRLVVEAAAAKVQAKLAVRFEADSFRVWTALVEAGLGFTALPLSAISREVDQGLLKYAPLIEPKVTRQLLLGTPGAQVSRATKIAIELVRSEIAALVRSGKWPAKLQFTPRRWRVLQREPDLN